MNHLEGSKKLVGRKTTYATAGRPILSIDGILDYAPKDAEQVAELIKLYDELCDSPLYKALK